MPLNITSTLENVLYVINDFEDRIKDLEEDAPEDLASKVSALEDQLDEMRDIPDTDDIRDVVDDALSNKNFLDRWDTEELVAEQVPKILNNLDINNYLNLDDMWAARERSLKIDLMDLVRTEVANMLREAAERLSPTS